MGYFPNGTSAMIFEEQFCDRCAHHDPEVGGCPVMDAHLLFNYEQHDSQDIKNMLEMFIPYGEAQCLMFIPHEAMKADSAPGGPPASS